MLIHVALTVVGACLFTEAVGYVVHILLHSDKIEFLSRNHMIHHLKVYKPKASMRPEGGYQASTEGRAAVDGIGFEWLAPIGIILAGVIATATWAGMPWFYQVLFIAVALAWGRVVFGVMHDAMHLKGFWMEKHPLTRRWFQKVRRLHDIHHMDFADDGRMTKNFGICFFFLDSLFRSRAQRARPFNEKGYRTALKRYAFIFR